MEFASEPRTARSSPDWTAQHRCDSTQNWCPQSRVVALWAATLPTPWRMLPSALSCRVQTWAPQPSCPVPRQPLGRSGRLFAVPAVHGPPRFEQASPSAALALCPSAAPPGAAERGGGAVAAPRPCACRWRSCCTSGRPWRSLEAWSLPLCRAGPAASLLGSKNSVCPDSQRARQVLLEFSLPRSAAAWHGLCPQWLFSGAVVWPFRPVCATETRA